MIKKIYFGLLVLSIVLVMLFGIYDYGREAISRVPEEDMATLIALSNVNYRSLYLNRSFDLIAIIMVISTVTTGISGILIKKKVKK